MATPTHGGPPADMLVIGAGVNGAAVAREAALSGLRVTLVEAEDLAAGTSAASSRLVHGGIRYLENGEVRLVRESLAERERLLASAPHLVRPYPLLIPLYAGNRRGRATVRAGMIAYDVLSPDKSTPRHRMFSAEQTRRRYPGLATDGLAGAALYHDAIAPAAERLVVEQVLDAAALGATVRTHMRVCGIEAHRGELAVTCVDRDGATDVVGARTVVNCAGPWVDGVLGGGPELIGGTKGSHLVVDPFPGAPPTGVHYEADDGRAVLVLPQPDGTLLLGSTDIFVTGDEADAQVTADEVEYLLAQVNRLIPGARLGPDDVVSAYCGVRPLPRSDATSAAGVSRDHHVVADPARPGLVSVVGGKLTTHRALGELVLRRTHGRRRGLSRRLALPGGRCADWPAFRERFHANPDHPAQVLDRLLDLYGVRAERVLDSGGDGERIEGTDALAAEVALALGQEFATTLTDVMARRLLLARRPDRGLGCAPAVAEIAAGVAGWSPQRVRDELEDYRRWAGTQVPVPTTSTRSAR